MAGKSNPVFLLRIPRVLFCAFSWPFPLRVHSRLFAIRYNLACYACQLGNQEEAWDWLEDAFELGDSKRVKLMALDDLDLEPFWAEIGEV
jgi:hypothetical protein